MTLESRIVSVALDVPAPRVYAFAKEMTNLPRWASGLSSGIHRDGDRWFAESPMGRVQVEMVPDNAFGVLDHDVTLPDGKTVHNALRVSPCGDDGSVVVFVVLRQPGEAADAFEKDGAHVRSDLEALKALLEREGA